MLSPKSTASVTAPSHPSQLSGQVSATTAPPPLMRAPPPLIRYDQVDKLGSDSSLISTALRMPMSNHGSIMSEKAKPIKSSLFDTSDLAPGSHTHSRPVLNVPQIPKPTMSSMQQPSMSTSPRVPEESPQAPGALDLSKNSPAPSPIQTPSPKPSTSGVPQENLNPDMFKVFNLKPGTMIPDMLKPQMTALPTSQQFIQPILMPQQVRQNTPNTLAYRQQTPMATNPQITSMPQFIRCEGLPMPIGALVGNMVITVPQSSTGPIPQQFLQMGLTSLPNVSQAAPLVPNAMVNTSIASPILNINQQLFRCPYCPKIVPLQFAHVQQHIETNHPGSSIMFLPLDMQNLQASASSQQSK